MIDVSTTVNDKWGAQRYPLFAYADGTGRVRNVSPAWESGVDEFGQSLSDEADPDGDADGDGASNAVEYGTGTDALDATSRPVRILLADLNRPDFAMDAACRANATPFDKLTLSECHFYLGQRFQPVPLKNRQDACSM